MTTPITDPALVLALSRALGGLPIDATDQPTYQVAKRAAEHAGRALVDCTTRAWRSRPRIATAHLVRGFALGWVPQSTPSPEETQDYPVRMLPPLARLTWACCLGLAWPDRTADPYPGEPFIRSAVVDVATELGASAIWVKAALDHDLTPAGLLIVEPGSGGQSLRLGPLAAAMPEPFVEAIRRFHELLPGVESHRTTDAALDNAELGSQLRESEDADEFESANDEGQDERGSDEEF